MVHRSSESNAFEFVRIASLRTAQLVRGCTARVIVGHRPVITAQLEVVAGKVWAQPRKPAGHTHDH